MSAVSRIVSPKLTSVPPTRRQRKMPSHAGAAGAVHRDVDLADLLGPLGVGVDHARRRAQLERPVDLPLRRRGDHDLGAQRVGDLDEERRGAAPGAGDQHPRAAGDARRA